MCTFFGILAGMKSAISRVVVAMGLLGACTSLPPPPPETEDEVRILQRRVGEADEAEVLARLGPPLRKVDFDNISQTAWDYVYSYGGYVIDLAIMIDRQGRVAQVIPVRREARDGRLR